MKKRKLTKRYLAEIETSVKRLYEEAAFWKQQYEIEREIAKKLVSIVYPADTYVKGMDIGPRAPRRGRVKRDRPLQ